VVKCRKNTDLAGGCWPLGFLEFFIKRKKIFTDLVVSFGGHSQ